MKHSVIIMILASFLLSGTLQADEASDKAAAKALGDAHKAVKARQGYMRLQAQQTGGMKLPGTGKGPITEETIKRAQNLYNLTLMMPDQFAEGSSMEVVGNSNAKIELWDMIDVRDGFIGRLNRQAGRLLELAKAGDEFGFQDEFKQLGGTCKKCHETFRD